MNKLHKLTSLVLAAVLCISMLSQASATTSASEAAVLARAKISDVLEEKLQSNESGKITAMVWLSDINMQEVTEEAINVCAIEESVVRTVSMIEDVTGVDIQAYIETKRAIAAENYITQNERIANTLFDSEDIVFISKYSPVILVNISEADAFAAAQSEDVLSLDYYEELQIESSSSLTPASTRNVTEWTLPKVNEITRVTDVHESATFGYSGAGVKIGVIETNLPTASLYPDLDLTLHTEGAVGSHTAHADGVLTIISSIAPDAKYYVTSYSTIQVDKLLARIEWLLDQGVNIINSSRALSNQANTYDSVARWIDHIAYQHDVHFVQATGNTAAEIESAAMAYNAIAVGNINIGDSLTPMSQFVIDSGSGRYSGSDYAYKPDLCAPGEPFIIESLDDYACEGTSFSTPQVTGVIALLCEQNINLKTAQNTVKAILTASVNFDYTKLLVPSDADYRVYGAGLLDCLGACWVAGNYRFVTASLAGSANLAEHSFTVTASDTKVRVSLAYNVKSVASGDHGESEITTGSFCDLNLEVIGPDGTVVGSSVTTKNNVEIVEFDPNVSGTYTIVVRRGDASAETIWYGLAWR